MKRISFILAGLLFSPSILCTKYISHFPPQNTADLNELAQKSPILFLFCTCARFTQEQLESKVRALLMRKPQCIYAYKHKIRDVELGWEEKVNVLCLINKYCYGPHAKSCTKCLAMKAIIDQHAQCLEQKEQEKRERQTKKIEDEEQKKLQHNIATVGEPLSVRLAMKFCK